MATKQKAIAQTSADEVMLARIREAAKQGAQLGYQMILKDLRSKAPAP